MSIWRTINDKIQLYNPTTGEPLFSYDKNNDQLDAEGNDLQNVSALEAKKVNQTLIADGDGYADVFAHANDLIANNNLNTSKIVIPSGKHTVQNSLNVAGLGVLNGGVIDYSGATIRVDGSGTNVGIDLAGTHNGPDINHGRLIGIGSTAPEVGMLEARTSVNGSAGGRSHYNEWFDGAWSKAAYYNYGSENVTHVSPYYRTSEQCRGSWTITPTNIDNISSPNVSLASGSVSMLAVNLIDAAGNHTNDGNGWGFIEGGDNVEQIALTGSWSDATDGQAGIYVDLTGGSVDKLTIEPGTVEGSPNHGLYLEGPSSGSYPLIDAEIRNVTWRASTYGVRSETGATIKNSEIINQQSNSAAYSFNGDVIDSKITTDGGALDFYGEFGKGSEVELDTLNDLTFHSTVIAPATRKLTEDEIPTEEYDGSSWVSVV